MRRHLTLIAATLALLVGLPWLTTALGAGAVRAEGAYRVDVPLVWGPGGAALPDNVAPDGDPADGDHADGDPADGDHADGVYDVAMLLDLINAARAAQGRAPLRANPALVAAAAGHAADMAAHGFFSHTGSDGSSAGARLRRAGYTWGAYGECIAWGQSTPEDALACWLASPAHRDILLREDLVEVGLGCVWHPERGWYWTADLGRPLR